MTLLPDLFHVEFQGADRAVGRSPSSWVVALPPNFFGNASDQASREARKHLRSPRAQRFSPAPISPLLAKPHSIPSRLVPAQFNEFYRQCSRRPLAPRSSRT